MDSRCVEYSQMYRQGLDAIVDRCRYAIDRRTDESINILIT